MKAIFVGTVLSCLPLAPALAEISLWRCTLGPITEKTVFFSGTLLVAFDSDTAGAWVSDPEVQGIKDSFVPVHLDVSDGTAKLRWTIRLPEHQGPGVARFAYKGAFDASGKTLTATGWVEGYDNPPPRTVSGPCSRS